MSRRERPQRGSDPGRPPVGAKAAPAAAAPAEDPAASYRIQFGDTISEIAIRHGLPTAHVLAQNGLSWKTPIFPGQLLHLEPSPERDDEDSPS